MKKTLWPTKPISNSALWDATTHIQIVGGNFARPELRLKKCPKKTPNITT